jgi:hypothetical protein
LEMTASLRTTSDQPPQWTPFCTARDVLDYAAARRAWRLHALNDAAALVGGACRAAGRARQAAATARGARLAAAATACAVALPSQLGAARGAALAAVSALDDIGIGVDGATLRVIAARLGVEAGALVDTAAAEAAICRLCDARAGAHAAAARVVEGGWVAAMARRRRIAGACARG